MSDISSPRDRGVSVTLKGGKDFNAPWIVFSGTVDEVHEDIRKAFGFDEVSNAGDLDLHDLAVEAAKAFHAQYGVSENLGGRPVGRGRGRSSAKTETTTESSGDAFDQAADSPASEPEEPKGPDFPALIEACASVAELKTLWAENRSVFDADADLLAKWKAKGKSIQAAA